MAQGKKEDMDVEKAKAKNQKRFNKKELDNYRKLLSLMRSKIAGDIQHLEKEGLNTSQRESAGDLSGYSLHMADMATDNFDRELTLGLASNEQNLLNLIDSAIQKIDASDGSFGLCEKTFKPISKKRLTAMPYAHLSLEAQELEEKERRRS